MRVAACPGDAEANYRLASLLGQRGLSTEAHYFATSALTTDPQHAGALAVLGNLSFAGGSHAEALAYYDRAAGLAPPGAELLFSRGLVLRRLGRDQEALQSYEAALKLSPDQAELLCNCGNVLQDIGRHAEALSCFDRALRSQPRVALLHYNRGNVLMAMGRMDDAITSFESAIALDPQYAEAWNNRGNALLDLGRAEAALESIGHALAIDPQYAEAHANRGYALLELDQPGPAIAAFRQALALDPADASTYNGLAMACQRAGNAVDAFRYFSLALSMEPDFLEARHNDALLRLFEGDFGHAWEGYETRIALPSYRRHLRKDAATVDQFLRQPSWQGPGGVIPDTVGIWAEQGIGDQILFSTMLPELIATGQRFVYEVDQRLLQAYRRAFSGVDFVALSDPPDERLTSAAAALFCGSLPRFFRTRAESFSRLPGRLLVADPQLVARYAGKLGEGFKVAVSWRSSRAGWVGRSKSVALAAFAPLFAVSGVRWVDVQYGDTAEERASVSRESGIALTHFDEIDYRDDLEDVLAIIENCDLVITTSNASAHFAGALGKPVWLLYPADRPPFHYWAHRGDHRCLWHPSVEIVSQPSLADWPALLDHVADRLRRRIS